MGNKYNMSIDRQKNLENLEKLRNEVNMSDDEYNTIKDIIYEESDPYYSPRYRQEVNRSYSNPLIKPLIIIVIILSILVSFIWHRLSIKEARENHPFNYHSAPGLCGMSENNFKSNLETADLITINNAINELEGRMKVINSLDGELSHIKFEKKLINDRLGWLKNRLSELKK